MKMKTKDIATNYGINSDELDKWLPKSRFKFTDSVFGGRVVDDGQNIEEIVNSFKEHMEVYARENADREKRIARENADQERAAFQKQAALASMLITSGFNFDGYTITKYSGYISGDDAVQANRPTQGWTGRVSGNVGEELLAGLVQIRRNALAELKEAAYALGCNAVIGVDFDYLTLDPETVTPQGGTLYLPFLFAVTANGNAVVIEKSGRAALG
ncbi:MAG: heavy metal-binding domain-containing protein [Sulfuritalea sp.]|nr:heavy metal-binding domain-containing protein [Sulfuritalea sp.]